MGTEIRFIPKGYTHTNPLFDNYLHRKAQELDFQLAWEHDLVSRDALKAKQEGIDATEYYGDTPPEAYFPVWPLETLSAIQMYENTTEGTPIKKQFTANDLIIKAWETGVKIANILNRLQEYTKTLDTNTAIAFLTLCLRHRQSLQSRAAPKMTHLHSNNATIEELVSQIAAWHFQELLPPIFWKTIQEKPDTYKKVMQELETGWQSPSESIDPLFARGSLNLQKSVSLKQKVALPTP